MCQDTYYGDSVMDRLQKELPRISWKATTTVQVRSYEGPENHMHRIERIWEVLCSRRWW